MKISEKRLGCIAKDIRRIESIQYYKGRWAWFLYLGIFMLSLLLFPIIISTLLFTFHIPITVANMPLSLTVACFVLYILTGRSWKNTVKIVVIGTLFAAIAIILCMKVYDWTWDGNSYHKSMVGLLRYGWNPLFETYYEYVSVKFPFLVSYNGPWIDSFTKGSEIWGACIYAVCNDIESGKAFNLISMIGSFCVCFGMFGQTQRVEPWQAASCGFLCVVNPISLSQCFTYYCDGFLWQMVTVCLAALLYLTFYECGEYRLISAYLVFLSINIGVNIKMSGLLFFGVLGISFFAFWSIERLCMNGYTAETKQFIGKNLIFFAVSAISGLLVTGATAYVINMIRFNNPFYTIIGKGSMGPVKLQLPAFQQDMSYMEMVITSLFSRTSNNRSLEMVEWKIPFFFDGDEYAAAQLPDARLAGWGIFFSGVFLVGLCVLVWWLINKDGYRRTKKYVVGILAVYIALLFCVPGLSWARYNAGLFYIPIVAMFTLFVVGQKNRNGCTCIAGMLGAVLMLNVVPNSMKVIEEFEKYNDYHTQLIELCKKMKGNQTAIGTSHLGRLYALIDQGITEINYEENLQGEEIEGIVFSPYGITYRFTSGPLGAETLEDFLDWVKQNDSIMVMAVKDEGSSALNDEIIKKARALGLNFYLGNDGFRKSYCAVLDGESVIYEEISDQRISYKLTHDGHEISLISAGYETGNLASIQVDGVEFSINQRGINIVLINQDTWDVVYSACVDSYLNNKIYR